MLLYPNEPANKYSVTYDLCNDSVQAQYLANRILEQAREDLIVSFSTTYYGIQVDAGDVVSVTNADYGWTNKLFRVVKVNEASLPDGSLGAKLEMTEYSAAVYDDFDITQYTPVPNSDLPSVNYFSPLSASTVTASNPSSPIPNFNVSIAIPAVGRVTFTELYYTTAAIPTANDWRLLSTAGRIDGEPVTPGTSYVFTNQVLPTGSDPSATYYFSYVVGNDISRSNRSPTSASFTWTPAATIGPPGPAGTNGLNGLNFINAYRVQSQNDPTPTFTTPTSGAAIPSGWVATAPAVSVGQIMWYIQGRYNSSSTTIDGVAAGTTAWTGPIAANIFQDIRSDNWNGSSPPVAATVASWGTDGYYIAKGDGNMYANGFYARGKVQIEGNNSDLLSTAARINQSDAAAIGVYAFGNQSSGRGIAGVSSGSSGAGVVGTATASPARAGVLALATSGGTVALEVAGGAMVIDNTTLVTNLNADLLDGQQASAFVNVSGSTTNANYLYFVNNNTAPADPVNRAAWIRVSTNSGAVVYFPGYI